IVQPGAITGAPISWLLGGNPFLDGVWLFANGVICFHQGYKFFMIALADQEEVNRVVREIKGLLPAAWTRMLEDVFDKLGASLLTVPVLGRAILSAVH